MVLFYSLLLARDGYVRQMAGLTWRSSLLHSLVAAISIVILFVNRSSKVVVQASKCICEICECMENKTKSIQYCGPKKANAIFSTVSKLFSLCNPYSK